MVTVEKKIKQKNSLSSGININIVLGLVGLIALKYGFGATFSTLVGIYLGYKLLKLILRVFGLIISLIVSLVSIVILITIISLLIF
jgi:hypothetical protein